MSRVWAEVWTRPGAASFGRVIADCPVLSLSGTRRANGVGEGVCVLAESFTRFDEILKPDPVTPANAVSSLIRVFSEADPSTPFFEFLPDQLTGRASAADVDVDVRGPDISRIVGYARVEPWDWDGTDDHVSLWPDHVYGGRNTLGELEGRYQPHIVNVWTTATGGTFTIGVSVDGAAYQTTAAIAYNASSDTVRTELVALSNVVEVEVTGAGSAGQPWTIQFVDPEASYTIVVNSGAWTGGSGFSSITQTGKLIPVGWTESVNPSGTEHGILTEFYATQGGGSDPALPAGSDWAIAFNGTEPVYPGTQRRVSVTAGGIYHASIQVYSVGAPTDVRLVIRDLHENPIAAAPGFGGSSTIPADTWTTLSITTVAIPANTDEVVFRIGHVGAGDPPRVYVASPELREGLPAATVGVILGDLYDDAVTDHAPGRVVWATSGSPYLTLGFTDTLDSAGAAWDTSRSLTLVRGQSYLQVLAQIAELGYEWLVRPDSVSAGTWILDVFNPGTAGTVTSQVVRGGKNLTRRDVRRFLPPVTDQAVEAAGVEISRVRSASAVTALGRIEGYEAAQDLGGVAEAGDAASAALADGLSASQSLTYTFTPGSERPFPFVDFDVFDTVTVDDPPDVAATTRRVLSNQFSLAGGVVEYQCQLGSESFVGVGAVYEGVRRLLDEFKAIRERAPVAKREADTVSLGGGVPTLLVAASDASAGSKAKADYVCAGVDDEQTIMAAVNALPTSGLFPGGRILLTEGNFSLSPPPGGVAIDLPFGVSLVGMGAGTLLEDNTSPGSATLIRLSRRCTLEDVAVLAYGDTRAVVLRDQFDMAVEGCWIETDGAAGVRVETSASECWIRRNHVRLNGTAEPAIWVDGGADQVWVTDCATDGGRNSVRVDTGTGFLSPARIWVVNNRFWSAAEEAVVLNCTRGGPTHMWVVGNHITAAGNDLDASPGRGAITVIGDPDTPDGLVTSSADTSPGTVVADNILDGAGLLSGIYLQAAHGTIVARNHVEDMAEHGVRVVDTSDAIISGNLILWTATPDVFTFDGIILAGNSDRNHIAHNRIISDTKGGGRWRFRYGINISAATCNATKYVGNDCSPGANFASAPYNDSGTGSVSAYPAAGAPQGDNFV